MMLSLSICLFCTTASPAVPPRQQTECEQLMAYVPEIEATEHDFPGAADADLAIARQMAQDHGDDEMVRCYDKIGQMLKAAR